MRARKASGAVGGRGAPPPRLRGPRLGDAGASVVVGVGDVDARLGAQPVRGGDLVVGGVLARACSRGRSTIGRPNWPAVITEPMPAWATTSSAPAPVAGEARRWSSLRTQGMCAGSKSPSRSGRRARPRCIGRRPSRPSPGSAGRRGTSSRWSRRSQDRTPQYVRAARPAPDAPTGSARRRRPAAPAARGDIRSVLAIELIQIVRQPPPLGGRQRHEARRGAGGDRQIWPLAKQDARELREAPAEAERVPPGDICDRIVAPAPIFGVEARIDPDIERPRTPRTPA